MCGLAQVRRGAGTLVGVGYSAGLFGVLFGFMALAATLVVVVSVGLLVLSAWLPAP